MGDFVAALLRTVGVAAEGTEPSNKRRNPYGEAAVYNTAQLRQQLAAEGCYFLATNPTIGTAVAFAVNASHDVTKIAFNWANLAGPGGKSVFLDHVTLVPTVAPASAVSARWSLLYEPTVVVPSAGNNRQTPVALPSPGAGDSVCRFDHFTGGAVMTMAAATASAKILGVGSARGVIPVVGEELAFAFGGDPAAAAGAPSSGSRQVSVLPPVVLPPQGSVRLSLWFPSNAITGLSAEFTAGWWER